MTQDSSGVQNSGAQTWSAERYARNARFVAELGSPVVELLAPRPGERILDLGCGDGALTVQLERAGASVVGVDSAPDLISAAQSLGLDARLIAANFVSPYRMEGRSGKNDMTDAAAVCEAASRPTMRGSRRGLRRAMAM